MQTLDELRESVARRLAIARDAVTKAQQEYEHVQAWLRTAEQNLADTTADVERRLAAIQVVEEMLNEGGGACRPPYQDSTQEEAMRAALIGAGDAMSAADLAEALKRGGYPFRTNDPANTVMVAASVNRRGYFVKTKEGGRTLIGLREWRDPLAAPNPFDENEVEFTA